ncbi:MAG: hypothetical protein EOS26_01040 [Mesorhizobium sp.]|nr:MAG: hypothetical protein EOS26_01040 [Mesorhizobium sp.]
MIETIAAALSAHGLILSILQAARKHLAVSPALPAAGTLAAAAIPCYSARLAWGRSPLMGEPVYRGLCGCLLIQSGETGTSARQSRAMGETTTWSFLGCRHTPDGATRS